MKELNTREDRLKSLDAEIVSCRKCPRLVKWREEVARVKRKAYQDWEYWGKPVPGFGDPAARVLVTGLAPGAHGSNRTGRQFTGDASGAFLYPALYRAGFASQPVSTSRGDGLTLNDMYITAAARCVPPGNKPAPEELNACQPYLERELQIIQPKIIVCLGKVAFDRVLKVLSAQDSARKFSHGAVYRLSSSPIVSAPLFLICSYHPSQQNTLTGKLTVTMFDDIWKKARKLLDEMD